MNENQSSQNNLLDTTDCLEAVGVFKGWKNFLFVIIVICLLLLQICFWLIDTGLISVPPSVSNTTVEEFQMTILPIMTESEQDIMPDVNNAINEIAPDPNLSAEPNLSTDPNDTIVTSDEPAESNEPAETEVTADSNQPADSNETMMTAAKETAEPEQVEETIIETIEPEVSPASEVQQKSDVLFGLTFDHLVWVMRFVNAVLILTATLYCLTMLFSLKVSMLGRLGGINHITRAFFLSLLALVLVLPWHQVFDCVAMGAIFTPDELVEWFSGKTDDIFDIVIYYLRFCGFWLLILLLIILTQLRSSRWAGAILRRLEII